MKEAVFSLVERKVMLQSRLNRIAEIHSFVLTHPDVQTCSRELDKVVVELQKRKVAETV